MAVAVIGGAISAFLFLLGLRFAGLVVAAVSFSVASLLSPFLGLCLMVVSLPLTGLAQVIPGAFTLSKAMAGVVGLSVLARVGAIGLRRVFRSWTFRVYCLLFMWSLALMPVMGHSWMAVRSVVTHGLLVGLAFLIIAVVRTPKQLDWFYLATAVGGAAIASVATFVGFSSVRVFRSGYRLSGGVNENDLAALLSICLFISLHYLVGQNRTFNQRLFVVLLEALIVVGIVLTLSRAAFGAIAVAVVAGLLIVRGVRIRRKTLVLIFVVMLFLAGFIGTMKRSPGHFQAQAEQRLEQRGGEAWGGRFGYIWPNKIRSVLNNPLMGDGPGGGRALRLDAHNDLLFILSERGFPGGLLFLLLLWCMYKEAKFTIDPSHRIVNVGLVVLTATLGLTHTTFLDRSYPLVVGLISVYVSTGLSESARVSPKRMLWHFSFGRRR